MNWEKLGLITPLIAGVLLFLNKERLLDYSENTNNRLKAPRISRNILKARIIAASVALIVAGVALILEN